MFQTQPTPSCLTRKASVTTATAGGNWILISFRDSIQRQKLAPPAITMDMRVIFNLKPWTDPNVPVPIAEGGHGLQKWQLLETFPTGTNGGNVHDLRYDDPSVNPDAITATFDTNNPKKSSWTGWSVRLWWCRARRDDAE